MRGPHGSIGDKEISPLVETDSMRIVDVLDNKFEFKCSWVKAVETRYIGFDIFTPGSFHIVKVKYTPLIVDPSIGSIDHIIGGVMSIGRVDGSHKTDLNISLVIARSVFQKKDIRRGYNNDPAIPKLKPGGVMDVSESGRFISNSVAGSVLQYHKAITHFTHRLPFGVC